MDDTQNNSQQYGGKSSGAYWHDQMDHAERMFESWRKRGDEVVDRYRDDRGMGGENIKVKFNILWSNIQVLTPALYGRPAKPEVSRRYMDSDPVSRLASTILERVLEYETEHFTDFSTSMEGVVQDRLLPGRGTVWIRFEPIFEQIQAPPEMVTSEEQAPIDGQVIQAHSPVDYVYWKDFLHSPARVWDEVWWVARAVYLTRDEGFRRFGDAFNDVPLNSYKEDNSKNSQDQSKDEFAKKAKVFEIWDKRTRKVCWVAKGHPDALDEREDPLDLEGFFPCPKPLYATTTNGSLIPVPDYCEYQDQARELDRLTQRIDRITRAIKAVGVYNAEFKEVARLLNEGTDNELIPVSNWAALAEKGGLKNAIELMDISILQAALGTLMNVRDHSKQIIYEICGISDLLRGQTKAEETLGAQQLKAQFGSMRLRDSQTDVARFASDIFRLKAQIICKFYPPQLIVQMSGVQNTPDGQSQQALAAAVQLLQAGELRDFHISVESDSLAQVDEDAEKQAASEAITAIGGFLQKAMPMVQAAPETLPMASEMLLFLVRRYRAGRGLESSIEQSMRALQGKAQALATNPQPTPEQIQAEAQNKADMMRAYVDTQAAQQKAQFDLQVQSGKLNWEMKLEAMKAQQEEALHRLDGQLKMIEIQAEERMEKYKVDMDASVRIQVAEINRLSAQESSQAQLTAAREQTRVVPPSA